MAYRDTVIRPFRRTFRSGTSPSFRAAIEKQTKAFEDYFRQSGQSAIRPWAEVVFWKMASQGGRANVRTREVLAVDAHNQPQTLWDALIAYVEEPTDGRFDRFRSLFRFRTKAIAIVATFPAFVSPDRFPMIDARIAKWVQIPFP
jgi:hypothetical protein